jgi:Xaa-Pro aminopeptidase
VPTERLIERRRAVKDAGEVATLREAGLRLASVARDLGNLRLTGRTEREVAATLDDAIRAAGFDRPAFETIVASGPNSALPHARPTARALREGEGVLLDFGGIYDGYCVDLSRTLHVGPETAAFRRLFDAVSDAHAAAIAEVKPGALPVDIDGAARRVLAGHGLANAFGHGTGHGLGLEVHEEPRISPHAPEGEPVLAGMVFTIEPGVYVPGTGGVRIEDDVLVVEGGCEILTDGI